MNSLCITGLIQTDLDYVAQLFVQGGMAQAQPAARDSSVSVAYWHQEVLKRSVARYTEEVNRLIPVDVAQDIGRLWEQMASDIFMANLRASLWGWADSRSAELLPFWRRFDPQTRFVLIAVRPERYIAFQTQASVHSLDHQSLRARWLSFHQALVRFHQDNPANTVLIDMDDYVLQPQAAVAACSNDLRLGLAPVHASVPSCPNPSDAALRIASDICRQYPELESYARQMPIRRVQTAFQPSGWVGSATEVATDNQAFAEKLRQLQHEFDQYVQRNKVGSTPTPAPYLPSGRLPVAANSVHETELIATLEQQRDQAKKELVAAKEESARLKSQQQVAAAKEKTNAEAATKLQQQFEQANKELTAVREELTRLKAQQQGLVAKEKEAHQKNDDLRAELQQVQQSLENYFVKAESAQQQCSRLESRCRRLWELHPDDVLVESIEVVDTSSEDATIGLRIQGLDLGTRYYDSLEFECFVQDSVVCFRFKRDAQGASAFARWPGLNDEDVVVLSPVGDEQTGPARARVLQSLSGVDWRLYRALVSLLKQELTAPVSLRLPAIFNLNGVGKGKNKITTKTLDQGLALLTRELDDLPPVLHFDELRLGMWQEEPEYEFLTFVFKNCWIGNRFVTDFQFRLASVNVKPGTFALNPRLEFHQSGSSHAFVSWFEESSDEYGPKLELRFAAPAAMDVKVWRQMAHADQEFVAALIAQLPIMIEHVKASQSSLRRNLDDWIKLAEDMHQIRTTSLEPASTSPVVKEAPAAKASKTTKAPRATKTARKSAAKSVTTKPRKPRPTKRAPAKRAVGPLQP